MNLSKSSGSERSVAMQARADSRRFKDSRWQKTTKEVL
jgi:hypothetical protein